MIQAWQAFKARPVVRRFYPGGFEPQMTRREAALILGVRFATNNLLIRSNPLLYFLY